MHLPPFMSVDRIGALCDWPTADRRRLIGQLRLAGTDGTEIDCNDRNAFWNAIIPFFLSVLNYKTLSVHLKQLSKKAYKRRLDQRAFDQLDRKVHLPRYIF